MGRKEFEFVFSRGDADKVESECKRRTCNLWFYRICSIALLFSAVFCFALTSSEFGAVLPEAFKKVFYLASLFLLLLSFVSCFVATYNQYKASKSSSELKDSYITGSQYSATYR